MTVIIGLTGGIGSGKSTISALFSKFAIDVIDADKVARSVVEKGKPAFKKIQNYFGGSIVNENGLDRRQLRDIIFANPDKQAWLNALLHPLIRTEILAQLKESQSDYTLLEAPLLIENKLTKYCDYILVVDVSELVQIKRATLRDGTTVKGIKAIMASQISRDERISHADFIIENNNVSFVDLEDKVQQLDHKFRTLILS